MGNYGGMFGFVVDSIINDLNRQYEVSVGEAKRIQTEKMYRQVNGGTTHSVPVIDQRVKFMYFGNSDRCKDHKGIITIATLVDDDDNTVSFGVSYCSPSDVYDKMKGKQMAFYRMCADPYTVNFTNKTHKEIMVRILCSLIAENSYPSWAKAIITENIAWNISLI